VDTDCVFFEEKSDKTSISGSAHPSE
jgi:hypothetical protein